MDTGRRIREHVTELTKALKEKDKKLEAAVKTVSENRRIARESQSRPA